MNFLFHYVIYNLVLFIIHMDLLQLYYFASLPLLTCNMLFYSMTSLSTSITSSQNIFKFIYEHKDSDFNIYKTEIEHMDLQNKLKIAHSLILNIFKKYCKTDNEYQLLLNEIKNLANDYGSENDDGDRQKIICDEQRG